ncbi:2-keto-4-pentenoate hydratase [Inhella proteolytica]|uniref:Fumarylacetoacetate hydrolase family protein n=1 Tax=Inhella proteolytica TaxID=2795029 RepID=A0A931IZ90_9BURK|nr:fumarylacetoacetate hydrolase family protein [Inhella proteolytica]MBH9575768.1 fumarylacetoacetate hydrolase family protein [Inhella proteolytica]
MNPIDTYAAALQAGELLEPWPELSLPQAYEIAARRHQLRLVRGERAVGRKIGHTNRANWASQGIAGPSWGWLYAASTAPLGGCLSLAGWREPKVELECVLRLRHSPRSAADLPDCVDAMALGLEIVDRPYPSWQISVADSVAAGGVHAGLRVGPWRAPDPALLRELQAELQVGTHQSRGSSALVFGSPLTALAELMALLAKQGAPALQAGELITTGALAPALPLQAGETLRARIDGLGECELALSRD